MISTALPTSFKKELLKGVHDFSASGGDVFKIALYDSDAVLGAATTAYSASNEIVGAGYTVGGATLTNVEPSSEGNVGFCTFADVEWPGATFTTNGALIYNSSKSNAAVAVLAFGSDKTVSSGTFKITFPTANSATAIIRVT
jgi:hypothetical protein